MNLANTSTACGLCLVLLSTGAYAGEPSTPTFGGPNAVENQIQSDFGDAWDQWKQRLEDNAGLVLRRKSWRK